MAILRGGETPSHIPFLMVLECTTRRLQQIRKAKGGAVGPELLKGPAPGKAFITVFYAL